MKARQYLVIHPLEPPSSLPGFMLWKLGNVGSPHNPTVILPILLRSWRHTWPRSGEGGRVRMQNVRRYIIFDVRQIRFNLILRGRHAMLNMHNLRGPSPILLLHNFRVVLPATLLPVPCYKRWFVCVCVCHIINESQL